MNDIEKLCRCCLKQINDGLFGDVEMIRDMLNALNLKMNLDVSEEPVICADCTENLHRFFTFKVICVQTEDSLLPFFNPEVDKNINLSETYLQINNSKSLDDKDVCRFCLCETPSDSSIQLNTILNLTSLIKNDLEKFFPEMNFHLVRDPVICKICYNSLLKYLVFTKKCLTVEENIQRYLVVEAIDVNVKVDLRRVQQFLDREIIKEQIDDIDTFEPVKDAIQQGEDVKEEPFFEEEIKSENCIQIEESQLDIKDENLELKFVIDSYASIPAAITDTGKQEICELGTRETVSICKSPTTCECNKCSFETESRENYYKHWEIHKEHSYINQSNKYCESIGKQKCYFRPDMVHHNSFPFIKVDGRKPCSLNKQKVTYKVLMHRRENKDLLLNSKHKASLTRNMSEVTNYKCVNEGCLFKTKQRNNLASHKLFHKNLLERLKNHKEFHSNSSITVSKCENEEWPFERQQNISLRKRKLIHKDSTKVTMYKCKSEGCSYKTSYKYRLPVHELIHKDSSEVTMYKCETEGCSYETKRKYNLAVHKLIHKDVSEVTMYKCENEGCSYETKLKYNLTMHKLVHKDVSEVTMYKCNSEGCLYETNRKNNLIKHQIIHKDFSEVTMYKCEYEGCSYETKRKHYLPKHLLTHKDPSEITMYKCKNEGCSYETKSKHYLPKHLLHRHKGCSEVTIYETKFKYDLSTNLRTYKSPAELRMYKCETKGCLYQARGKNNWIKHQLIHQDSSEARR